MEKIEYGDVNRFLVSIGLVLVSLSLAVPYFYLSEDFGLYIETDKLKLYSKPVQDMVCNKEAYVATIHKSLPWASGGLFLSGVISLIIGLTRWFKRQARIDEKENLDIQKLKLEINQLTPEERREKAKAEVEVSEIAEIIEKKKLTDATPDAAKEQAVTNYLNIEQRVVNHFKNYKTENFEILDNIKLGDRFWVDIFLEAKNPNYSDRIIEIKYASKSLSYPVVKDALDKLDNYVTFYLKFYHRKVVPVLLVVFSNETGMTDEKLRQLAQRVHSDTETYKSLKRLQVKFIEEDQIDGFDVKEILRR
jgi:hypothetical protein